MDLLTGMRVFAAVVDAGSFSAAADRLAQPRSNVSKHVMALEAHLGTRLLNRTTRRLSLTEAGRLYHSRCVGILADIAAAEVEAAELMARPTGTLRICAHLSFGIQQLTPILTDFQRLFPEVKIDITLNDRFDDLIIVKEGYDLAIQLEEPRETNLVSRKLGDCRRVACATPAYLAAHGTPRTPADLAGHSCLSYAYMVPNDEWHFRDAAGDVHKVKLNASLRANNGDMLLLAALRDAGIIRLPMFIVANALKQGALVELLRDYTARELPIYALFPARHQLLPKVRAFMDYLCGRLGAELDWLNR